MGGRKLVRRPDQHDYLPVMTKKISEKRCESRTPIARILPESVRHGEDMTTGNVRLARAPMRSS